MEGVRNFALVRFPEGCSVTSSSYSVSSRSSPIMLLHSFGSTWRGFRGPLFQPEPVEEGYRYGSLVIGKPSRHCAAPVSRKRTVTRFVSGEAIRLSPQDSGSGSVRISARRSGQKARRKTKDRRALIARSLRRFSDQVAGR